MKSTLIATDRLEALDVEVHAKSGVILVGTVEEYAERDRVIRRMKNVDKDIEVQNEVSAETV